MPVPTDRLVRGLLYDLWEDYTPKELALRSFLLRTDLLGYPVSFCVYLLLGYALSPAAGVLEVSLPPLAALMLLSSALLASFIAFQNSFALPSPAEIENERFGAVTKFGRWVFLTRQTLAIQAIHMSLSLVAASGAAPGLHVITHTMAPVSAGVAIFVTVQFFALVAPTADYAKECKLWEKRQIPYRELQSFMHIPAGFLGLLDVVMLKQRALALATCPPLLTLLAVYFVYVGLYIGLLHASYHYTGFWPYSLCKPLGQSVQKWASFALMQAAILCLFLVVALAAMAWAPSAW